MKGKGSEIGRVYLGFPCFGLRSFCYVMRNGRLAKKKEKTSNMKKKLYIIKLGCHYAENGRYSATHGW